MNVVWAVLIIIATTGIAVAAMLMARRRAPEGGYFADGDRASGVFGVIATGFSVLLGFLIFLAFESFDTSRSGAETEALTVAQQVQTAQLLPVSVRAELTGELVCYARWVVNEEWDQMESGTDDEQISPWGVALFMTLKDVELSSPVEESAYDSWLAQTSTRELARQDRIHGAAGVMPTPLWVALFFIGAIVVVYIFGFADSAERTVIQGLYMGAVVATITSMLLLLSFLDNPVHPGVGGLEPVAMERSLGIIDEALEVLGADIDIPCDANGRL